MRLQAAKLNGVISAQCQAGFSRVRSSVRRPGSLVARVALHTRTPQLLAVTTPTAATTSAAKSAVAIPTVTIKALSTPATTTAASFTSAVTTPASATFAATTTAIPTDAATTAAPTAADTTTAPTAAATTAATQSIAALPVTTVSSHDPDVPALAAMALNLTRRLSGKDLLDERGFADQLRPASSRPAASTVPHAAPAAVAMEPMYDNMDYGDAATSLERGARLLPEGSHGGLGERVPSPPVVEQQATVAALRQQAGTLQALPHPVVATGTPKHASRLLALTPMEEVGPEAVEDEEPLPPTPVVLPAQMYVNHAAIQAATDRRRVGEEMGQTAVEDEGPLPPAPVAPAGSMYVNHATIQQTARQPQPSTSNTAGQPQPSTSNTAGQPQPSASNTAVRSAAAVARLQ